MKATLLLVTVACGDWVPWPSTAPVPKGSNFRLDITTGERWLEVNETVDSRFEKSVNAATLKEDVPSVDDRRAKILSALHKLPDGVVNGDLDEMTDDMLEAIWDRRQAELAEVMEQVSEVVKAMEAKLNVLKTSSDDEVLIETLEALDDDVDDVDNAHDFVNALKGLPTLATLAHLAPALQVIGTLVKNDFDLQQTARPLVFPAILQGLTSTDATRTKKALYALGSLLRNNKNAILDVYATAVPAITQAIHNHDALPVRDKAVTLLGDLFLGASQANILDASACDAVLASLRAASLRKIDRFLHATHILLPHCRSHWEDRLSPVMTDITDTVSQDDDLDPDHKTDLLDLLTKLRTDLLHPPVDPPPPPPLTPPAGDDGDEPLLLLG